MRCNILALLAFAALTTSVVLPADIPQDVDRRELDLATARDDLVERYEPIGGRFVIGGGAAVTGGAAISGSAAETGGAAISGGAAITGGAAISGGAAETTGGAAKTTGAAQTTGAAAETTGEAAKTTSAAQITGAQPTAAATSAAPTSGGSCSDIPYGSSLSRPFQVKIIPSTTTQTTSNFLDFIPSLSNILGSLFRSGSNSKGGQPTPTPSPAYLSSQGYPTSQKNAGTFSILQDEDYLVSVDPKTCRPSPDCSGYYSGNISDVTTDIPPFHFLTFTSSLDQAKAATLNGRWTIETPNPPASSSWRFNFWPFSNRGKPLAQPQTDPSLVLINPAFGTAGSEMNFGALVTLGQFSSSAQVSGTGSSTYQFYTPYRSVNLKIVYVQQ